MRNVPIAQLVRATLSKSDGYRFESYLEHLDIELYFIKGTFV